MTFKATSGPSFALGQDELVFSELDFVDIQFYFETLIPTMAEYKALDQILEFTRLGLGMAGDKNDDGKLEYHEVEEYLISMRRLCGSDQQLLTGLKLLLGHYWTLAGEKGWLSENDLFNRFYQLLAFMVTETLIRPPLVTVAGEKLAELLSYELMRDTGKYLMSLVDVINLDVQSRGSPYRIQLDTDHHAKIVMESAS